MRDLPPSTLYGLPPPRRRQPRCPACGIDAPAEDWRWLATHILMHHGPGRDTGTWLWKPGGPGPHDYCGCGRPFANIPEFAAHLQSITDLKLHFAAARLKP